MVIGNNLARAFGLVGSMSIVRFRMAIKNTQDIVFIFFTLAVGMAAGVGQHMIAFAATGFISIIVLLLAQSHYASSRKSEYLLQFHFASDDEATPYVPVLGKYCSKFKLVNIKSAGEGDIIELSYYVVLKRKETDKDFIRQIGQIEGVSDINFFFDEE